MNTIAILGDAGVGKTSFINHLNNIPLQKVYYQSFEKEEAIIGDNLFVAFPHNINISKENFSHFDQFLIMFDLSSKPSFEHAKKLYYEIVKKGLNLDIILIGNKYDIRKVHFLDHVSDKNILNWNKTQIYKISLLNTKK